MTRSYRYVAGLALVTVAVSVLVLISRGREPGVVLATDGDPEEYEGTFTVLESSHHGPELCYSVASSLPPQCGGLPLDGWDWNAVDGEETRNGTTWATFHVRGTYDGTRLAVTDVGPPRTAQPAPPLPALCERPDVVDASHGGDEWEAVTPTDGPTLGIPGYSSAWISRSPNHDFIANVLVQKWAAERARDHIRSHYLGALCLEAREGVSAERLQQLQDEIVRDEEVRRVLDPQSVGTDPRRGIVVLEVWVVDDRARDYVQRRWGDLVRVEGLLTPVP